jgi:hypothetical protein
MFNTIRISSFCNLKILQMSVTILNYSNLEIGKRLSVCLKTEENQENLCQGGRNVLPVIYSISSYHLAVRQTEDCKSSVISITPVQLCYLQFKLYIICFGVVKYNFKFVLKYSSLVTIIQCSALRITSVCSVPCALCLIVDLSTQRPQTLWTVLHLTLLLYCYIIFGVWFELSLTVFEWTLIR